MTHTFLQDLHFNYGFPFPEPIKYYFTVLPVGATEYWENDSFTPDKKSEIIHMLDKYIGYDFSWYNEHTGQSGIITFKGFENKTNLPIFMAYNYDPQLITQDYDFPIITLNLHKYNNEKINFALVCGKFELTSYTENPSMFNQQYEEYSPIISDNFDICPVVLEKKIDPIFVFYNRYEI